MNRVLTVFMANSIGAQAQETKGKPQKILVAYFSWSGNTREIAKQIQQQTGGDLFEIKTVKPYPHGLQRMSGHRKKGTAGKRPSRTCRHDKEFRCLRRGFHRLSQLVGNDAANAVHLFGKIRPER
jgi:hypothetical protein